MAHLNNFAARFRKGLASASPFTSVGTAWCPHCKLEVAAREKAHHQGTTYAFKRWCLRCGHVLTRGVHDNVVLLSGESLNPAAMAWSTAREGITR